MYLRAMETACHGGNKHTHGMGVCMGFPATLHYALNTRWWRLWAWGEQLKRLDVWVSIISSVDSIFFLNDRKVKLNSIYLKCLKFVARGTKK